MDNHVQVDKPEAKTEASSAAEPEIKAVEPTAAPVSTSQIQVAEPKSEALPPAPPAPMIAPPRPPARTVEAKANEPKPAPAVPVIEAKAADPKPAADGDKQAKEPKRIAFVIEDDFDASEIFGKAMEAN